MKTIMCAVLLFAVPWRPVFAQDSVGELARILRDKGVITSSELTAVESSPGQERVRLLASLLEAKGVLTSVEVARLQMNSTNQVQTESASVVPAVYTPPPIANASAEPQAPPNGRETATAAPPVTSQSRFPVTVYGNILLNSFFDTSLNNIEDVPLFAGKQGSDPFPNDKSFGMTARQSRLGLRYQGPEVGGAAISGQVEVDFFGGKAALGNGINMDLPRLRLALGRLDWKNFSLVAGQDWSVFAPLNPTSLAEYAIPSMSASGNPWIRSPQIRAEIRHAMSDAAKLQWQIAATDPDMGDYQTTQFLTTRSPGIGERGRMPGLDTRLGFTNTMNGRDFSVGVSGHYGRGEDVGTIASLNVVRPVDSWGVALDWSLPFTKYFALTGEAYEGRALGIFSVASGESVGAVGTRGEHGVLSRGGWAQAQFNINPKWQVNLAYGIDQPEASELPVGNRDRNQTYMGNLMYKLTSSVTFAWEFRRFLTDFRNQLFADERGDQANLAVLYSF
jgi:hypothetical protein